MKSRILFGLFVAALLHQPSAAAVNSHYSDLLRKGIASHRAGRSIEATETLRLACFGMLEEPTALSSCLVHLSLAQSASGDRIGFQETWERIAEVEREFTSYTEADLAAEERARFESILATAISPSLLAEFPVFAPTPQVAPVDELANLKPRKRRKELERRAASQPQEPRWPLLLAEMDVAAGDVPAARSRLTALLALHPEASEARCLAGALAQGAGDDEATIDHYSRCPEVASDATRALPYLLALGRLERWNDATALYQELEENVRATVRENDFGQQVADLAAAAETPEAAERPEPEGTISPPTLPSLELGAEIERIRSLAEAAQSLSELDSALVEARNLASAAEQDSEVQLLAAEIAYRAASWQEAALYFQRAGEIPRSRPLLLFYKAVALYETGQRSEAEETLRKCLSRLHQTTYVKSYIELILPDRNSQ